MWYIYSIVLLLTSSFAANYIMQVELRHPVPGTLNFFLRQTIAYRIAFYKSLSAKLIRDGSPFVQSDRHLEQ